MKAGRVVFDGVPADLTDAVSQELYGLDAHAAMGIALQPPSGVPGLAAQPA